MTAVTNALKEDDTINWSIKQGHMTSLQCEDWKFPAEICKGAKGKEWRNLNTPPAFFKIFIF